MDGYWRLDAMIIEGVECYGCGSLNIRYRMDKMTEPKEIIYFCGDEMLDCMDTFIAAEFHSGKMVKHG